MNTKTSRYPLNLLGAFANNVITISEKPENSFVKDHALLAALKSSYADFFEVFGKQTFSGLGKSVEEAYLLRDEPLKAMISILKGFEKITGYPFRQDGVDLLTIIDQYCSDIIDMNYAAETETIDKLISVLDGQVNLEKLARLNLSEVYETLKSRQTGFKSIFFRQTEANAGLRKQKSASSLKAGLIQDLRNYLNLVSAMKYVAGWDTLYAQLNEVAKAANNSVSTSKTTDSVDTKAQ